MAIFKLVLGDRMGTYEGSIDPTSSFNFGANVPMDKKELRQELLMFLHENLQLQISHRLAEDGRKQTHHRHSIDPRMLCVLCVLCRVLQEKDPALTQLGRYRYQPVKNRPGTN